MCGLFRNCDSISPNEFEDAMMYEDGGSGSAVVEDASRLRHIYIPAYVHLTNPIRPTRATGSTTECVLLL
jgi:hypothetical protein